MINLDARVVADALPYAQLIDALDEAFRSDVEVPQRVHHEVAVPGKRTATLLLMSAWRRGATLGVKVATIFPDNATVSLPAVHASYLLLDATTGAPLAILDGAELTLRRTACASALASRYLSRADSRQLLMVGTGSLAPHMIAAHAAARPIDNVCIWGRRVEAARSVAAVTRTTGLAAEVTEDLREAVSHADVICCATMAVEPLIEGEWLREGQHLDLVGAYTPAMREADSAAVGRAEVYVDTYAGALAEAGEIVQAIAEGALGRAEIRGELAELARGTSSGRTSDDSITLFKSVGTAVEDLAAAELAIKNSGAD